MKVVRRWTTNKMLFDIEYIDKTSFWIAFWGHSAAFRKPFGSFWTFGVSPLGGSQEILDEASEATTKTSSKEKLELR